MNLVRLDIHVLWQDEMITYEFKSYSIEDYGGFYNLKSVRFSKNVNVPIISECGFDMRHTLKLFFLNLLL